MKINWMFPLIALVAISCSQPQANAEAEPAAEEVQVEETPALAMFGAEITDDGAKMLNEVIPSLGENDSIEVKLTGTVNKVCQVKGCWMTMPYGEEGESMRVSFLDYGFFVPKDIDGKEVVVEGKLFVETISVADLQHYAEDEGQSEEEIASITEPERSVSFVANGVIVKDYTVEEAVEAETEEVH